ncbi:hypothetical protein PSTT_07876, partial [Puccinia striiformis]
LASELPSLFPLVNEPSKFSKISLGLYKWDDPDQSRHVEGLRSGLLVCGDSLQDQFTVFSSNPNYHCIITSLLNSLSQDYRTQNSALQMALLSVVPIKKEAVSSVLISNVVGVLTASMTDTPSVSTSDPNQISDKVVEQTDQQSLQAIKPLSSWPPNILSITLVVCLLLLVIAARDSDIQILGNVIKSGSEDGHEELNYGN